MNKSKVMKLIEKFSPLFFCVSFLFTACVPDSKPEDFNRFARKNNTAVVRLEGDPDRLNPITTTTNYGRQVSDLVGLYLMSFDPYTLKFQPMLVNAVPKSAPITSGLNKGGVAYSFEIHPEAVWDNGSPVTGNDFDFTIKTILNPAVDAAALRSFAVAIRDVKVDPKNPKKFTVITADPTIEGLYNLANLSVVLPTYLYDPKQLLKDVSVVQLGVSDTTSIKNLLQNNPQLQQFADVFNSNPYARDPKFIKGCGAYQLISWETGQKITLKKKKDWWGDKLADRFPMLTAKPEGIVFKPIENPATAVAALKGEEIDAMNKIAPEDFLELKKDSFITQRYELSNPPSLTYYYLAVNTRVPKLADKSVRQALAHAINVDEVIKEVYKGFGVRAVTQVPTTSELFNRQLKPIPFDIAAAKKILKDGGWKDTNNNGIVDKNINGQQTELSIAYTFNGGKETSRTLALLIKNNARKAGIDIQLNGIEGRMTLEALKKREFELVSAGMSLSPIWNPKQGWHTEGDNRTGFGNASVDATIDEMLNTIDRKKRMALAYKLQEIMYDEQAEISLFIPSETIAIHRRFSAPKTVFVPGYIVTDFQLKRRK
jgi:peptide/nickel transport system substrate-binding protein